MKRLRYFPAVLVFCAPLMAGNITLTFESLVENEIVTNQFASSGVMIGGITPGMDPAIYTAGSMLNEFDFPPHSGVNVLVDVNGPVQLTFTPSTVFSAGAYFTYTTQLTLQAFSPGGALLGTALSAGDSNFGANEWIGFTFPTPEIGSLRIAGLASGSSFTMDDLTYDSVPEPTSALLLFAGLFVLGGWSRFRA